MARVILFEMNEVPLRILDDWIAERPRSALARAVALGRVYRTQAEDGGHLSPWVTWPSLHRGVANDRHFIADFGQDLTEVDREFPPLWQVAADAGARVGVFNSLHSHPLPADLVQYDFHVPDPFAPTAATHPASLSGFQRINLMMSRESGRNVAGGMPVGAAMGLASSLPALGLRPKTVLDIGRQLLGERRERWKLVRRRTYQSVLTFDIFMRRLERSRPQLATYFTNHVASALHRYWAAAYPDDYDGSSFDADWRATYRHEIAFTMQKLDDMVDRLLAYVGRHPDTQLVMASSMGQEAVESGLVETQLYLVDADRFFGQLGLAAADWQQRPAMLPQYNVEVAAALADQLAALLGTVRIGDEPLGFRRSGAGFFSLDFGHANLPGDMMVTVDGRCMAPPAAGLRQVEITDRSGTTAYHIPAGTLILVGSGVTPSQERAEVSTLDIAPHVLGQLGLARPSYMKAAAALAS